MDQMQNTQYQQQGQVAQQKDYSLFDAHLGINQANGNTYIFTVAEINVPGNVRAEDVTVRDRATGEPKTSRVMSWNAAVNGEYKVRRISELCGLQPATDRNNPNIVWVRFSAWNNVAERLQKYLEKHPNGARIVITGALRVVDRQKDGVTYRNTEVTVSNFVVMRENKPRQNGGQPGAVNAGYGQPANAGYAAGPGASQPTAPAPQQGYNAQGTGAPAPQTGYPAPQQVGVAPPSFADLDGWDGELPF